MGPAISGIERTGGPAAVFAGHGRVTAACPGAGAAPAIDNYAPFMGRAEIVATGNLLYRLFERPGQTIDGGLGFRWWGASADMTLVGRGPLATQSVSESESWADPLIAARYHVDFGYGLGLTAYGDLGGFGIAAHSDWQISGMLDYV